MIRRPVLLIAPLALAIVASRAQAQRIAEIQMAPPYLRMVPNAQTQASATAYDSLGTPLNIRFRWYSSNINVAAVDSTGMVRAVAPGMTLITALADAERGRRRGAQMTVRVVGAPGASGVMIVPAAPGTPGAQPMPPGTPMPSMPPTVMVIPRNMDSTMKASINCSEPFMNAANPMQACYDRRPYLRGPEPWSSLSRCGGEHGQPLMLLVRVNETGQVTEVMPFTSGQPCPGFVDSTVAAARTMTFDPAQRGGQPVSAWVRVLVRGPMPREMPRGPDPRSLPSAAPAPPAKP